MVKKPTIIAKQSDGVCKVGPHGNVGPLILRGFCLEVTYLHVI